MQRSLWCCASRIIYWSRVAMIDKFGTFPILMKKRPDRNPCLLKAAAN